MTKKIAIQLFGHLRSFRKTAQSLFSYIIKPQLENGYEVDIFIHTWNETDHSTITWHNQNGEQRGRLVDDKVLDEVKRIYKPKKILVEKQIDVPEFIITEKIAGVPRSFKGVVNVAYTKYMASKLRREYAHENNIEYDWVIVTRPDIIFHQPFIIDEFLHVYDEYKWQIPQNGLFFGYNFFARGNVEDKHMIGGSDIIFFGNANTIDKATSCYEEIKAGIITPENISKDFYCFEVFWYNYWQKMQLEPIRIKYLQFSSFNIVRNEEEYNIALKRCKNEKEKVDAIKISALNGYDANIRMRSPKNFYLLKFEREILKILPYCLIHKKITKLTNKIKGI